MSKEVLERSISEESQVICRNLECGYPGKPILFDLNLQLARGESIALLGMNGAGKSTFMKTIAGELKPLRGQVEVRTGNGDLVDRAKLGAAESARLLSMVPQEEGNPFSFTVIEVVAMGRLAYGNSIFDSKEDLEAAYEAMRRVECEHLADRAITELSGGEKQRVLIARSLAQATEIVFMDEPTSHLDPPHQLSIATLIASLAREGKCVVTAVHDLNLASIMATRALLLGEGRIFADGPVEQVIESHALDVCYKTQFERVRTQSGRLVVIPLPGAGY